MSKILVFGVLFASILHLIRANEAPTDECETGWTYRESSASCYWFESALTNVSWREALWSCRERGAELFEPADAMEMQWLETQLPSRMNGEDKWHVYGHSDLYGMDAWHSGKPLNSSFGNRIVLSTRSVKYICNNSRALPSECALFRLISGSKFELSFSNCLHVDGSSKIGYICKKDARTLRTRRQPEAELSASSSGTLCDSEWIARADDSTYVYSITSPSVGQSQSWYTALHWCRETGGELPTIESATEAHWIFDQIKRTSKGQSSIGKFFVNLHEWAYNRNGWGWPSGEPVDSSVLQWASGEPDENCGNQDNCGTTARVKSNNLVLSDHYCFQNFPNVTIVCKRLRSSCLSSPSRNSFATSTFSSRACAAYNGTFSVKTAGSPTQRTAVEERTDKPFFDVDRIWVFAASGIVFSSLLVLFIVSLVVSCIICWNAPGRLRKDESRGRSGLNRSVSEFSGRSARSDHSYDVPTESVPSSPTPHSSAAVALNQNKNGNRKKKDKKLRFAGPGTPGPIAESSQNGPAYELTNIRAASQSPDPMQPRYLSRFERLTLASHMSRGPPGDPLSRQESHHTYVEIPDELKDNI